MSIEKLKPFLASTYENFPKSRTIGLVILRTTQSETIFRTEGSGESMSSEFVQAGIKDTTIMPRLVMTKRKQIAPERRKGREFLRNYNLLYSSQDKGKSYICSLNTNHPCTMCIDCFLYGYAAGKGDSIGSQKSRVWTEDAFSLLSITDTVEERTINALYETGTMRLEKEDGTVEISTSLNTSEYIKPGVHFLDIVTLKDVTADELRYVLGNILLTSRYGAISSRIGRIENQILGVFGGFAELPSSLELVQLVYDSFQESEKPLEHPLQTDQLVTVIKQVIANWNNKRGIAVQLSDDELNNLIADIDENWSLENQETFLKRLNECYESFRKVPEAKPAKEKTSKKKKETESED